MQGALDTRAKLASPARKEDEERDEKSSQKLIGRLDRPHQQLFQQHRSHSVVRRCLLNVRFARKRTRLKGAQHLILCRTLTPRGAHAPTRPRAVPGSGPTSSMTRRAISAGPDRSYVVRPRRCYCTMTVAPIWTRL